MFFEELTEEEQDKAIDLFMEDEKAYDAWKATLPEEKRNAIGDFMLTVMMNPPNPDRKEEVEAAIASIRVKNEPTTP